jgi:hypothetical protein
MSAVLSTFTDMMLESLELNDVVLANPRAGSFPGMLNQKSNDADTNEFDSI